MRFYERKNCANNVYNLFAHIIVGGACGRRDADEIPISSPGINVSVEQVPVNFVFLEESEYDKE